MLTIEDFINGNCYVNCRTQQEVADFLSILHTDGCVWQSGACLLDEDRMKRAFFRWQEDTCFICYRNRDIRYSDKNYILSSSEVPQRPIVLYGELAINIDINQNTSLLLKLLGVEKGE